MTSGSSSARSVLYASNGYTTHDRRFIAAAIDAGWRVVHLRFDAGIQQMCHDPYPAGAVHLRWLGDHVRITTANVDEFKQAFSDVVSATDVDLVHAGPIHTVAHVAVSASPVPVIAMSWASDLLIDASFDADCASLARATLERAVGVLADSEHVADVAASFNADRSRITVVPWGVDLDSNPMQAARPGDGRLRLLSLRSFEPVYDLATLLRGVAEVSRSRVPVELVMAGDGSLAGELRRLAGELDLESTITWIGRVEESQVSGLLRECDLHVSTARSDGSSISLLQSMAAGRPSIVPDIPSNREWITPGSSGWLFSVGDPSSLAEEITRAADHPELRAAMASEGRRVVELRADWSRNKHCVIEMYERLVCR